MVSSLVKVLYVLIISYPVVIFIKSALIKLQGILLN
jgi:hypothetical protein